MKVEELKCWGITKAHANHQRLKATLLHLCMVNKIHYCSKFCVCVYIQYRSLHVLSLTYTMLCITVTIVCEQILHSRAVLGTLHPIKPGSDQHSAYRDLSVRLLAVYCREQLHQPVRKHSPQVR